MTRLYFAFLLCGLFSCGKKADQPPAHSTQVDVIYNITENMTSPPVAEPILGLFGFTIDTNQEADFEMVLLKGTVLNASQKIHLDGVGSRPTVEEIEAHAQIVTSFCDAVRISITEYPKQYGKGMIPARVECFATIAQELGQLAESNASQRVLLVFSSLMENEPAFSSYTPQGQYLLQYNQEKAKKLLLSRHSSPDNLRGVTIYFVYDPNTREQDIRFAEMFNIYKQLLHARGARVVAQASNKSFQL